MRTALLGEIASVNPRAGGVPADTSVSFVGMAELDAVSASALPRETRRFGEVSKGYTVFRDRDILAAKITPCWENGKIGQAELDHAVGVGSTEFHVIRPGDVLDGRYLLHFLRQNQIKVAGEVQMTGSGGQKRVPASYLKDLSVPLPPLDKQRRIAAILDLADAIRAKRRQVLAHLDSLTTSTFREMFGSDYWRAVTTTPRAPKAQGWAWVPLSDVAKLATGHTPDREKPEYWNGTIPWISLPEIRGLDGTRALDTQLHVSELGVRHSSAVILPAGTVCFSRTASIGFVTQMGQPMATSQDFHNWTPGAAMDSLYLMAALRSSREHLLGNSDGSTHKTIYQRVAERFRILLPPLELQRQFASRWVHIQESAGRVKRALAADDELFASLGSHAFRGEL